MSTEFDKTFHNESNTQPITKFAWIFFTYSVNVYKFGKITICCCSKSIFYDNNHLNIFDFLIIEKYQFLLLPFFDNFNHRNNLFLKSCRQIVIFPRLSCWLKISKNFIGFIIYQNCPHSRVFLLSQLWIVNYCVRR